MPWIISHAVFTINRHLIRQDGKTSYKRVFNKAHSGPLVHFGERVLAHHQATPPAQKLRLRAQPQKPYSLWLGKCVITGMHIVAHEGQVLKARTVTRLVRDQQFNSVEFNKIVLPPHESEPHYQEPQEDRVALQELLRSFIMQQQSKMKIQDFKLSDQHFNVTVEHAESILTASPAEGANQRASAASTATSAHPLISFLIPLVFRYLREFSNLSKHFKLNLSNQFRSEEQSEQSQDLRILQRFQRCFRTSRKLSSNESRSDQCRSSRSSIRRRVASRSHTSGMVSRGPSGIFSRSYQGSYHKRAQADRSSWS